jgi:hypothetical protein
VIAFNRSLAISLLFCILFLITFPIFYVVILNTFVSHPGLRLSAKWSDNTFSDWETRTNAPILGGISNEGGSLKINMEGTRHEGEIVAAQKTQNLSANLASNDYIKVSIMASSINVAARIVIWTDFEHPYEILLKTYNDRAWHHEIISLPFFGLSGNISMIELSMKQLKTSNVTEWILYEDLSFGNFDI